MSALKGVLLSFAVVFGLSCQGRFNKQAAPQAAPNTTVSECACAVDPPQPEADAMRQAKEYEAQAKTLFGEWERISADVDIGFGHEQVFGKGVRVAPKSFFLGDPTPGMFFLHWSWDKYDGSSDHYARLHIEPPKDSLPRAFAVHTIYFSIRFHVLSSGNRAEIWVVDPWAMEEAMLRSSRGEKFEKYDKIFAGYYRQKDSVNRFQATEEIEEPKIQAKSLEEILRNSR